MTDDKHIIRSKTLGELGKRLAALRKKEREVIAKARKQRRS